MPKYRTAFGDKIPDRDNMGDGVTFDYRTTAEIERDNEQENEDALTMLDNRQARLVTSKSGAS